MTTLEQKITVMQAFKEGKPVEYSHDKEKIVWARTSNPIWDWSSFSYRVVTNKPSINWDHVHPDLKYLAINENGNGYLWESKPKAAYSGWSGGKSAWSVAPFKSFDPGNCDWEDSLVERPKVT